MLQTESNKVIGGRTLRITPNFNCNKSIYPELREPTTNIVIKIQVFNDYSWCRCYSVEMVITNPGGYEYIIEEMWRIFGTSYMDWKLILEAKTHFYDMLSTVCNPIFDANIFPGHLSQEEVWRLEKRTNYLNQVRKDAQRIERNNNRNLRRALKKVTEDQQSFDIYA